MKEKLTNTNSIINKIIDDIKSNKNIWIRFSEKPIEKDSFISNYFMQYDNLDESIMLDSHESYYFKFKKGYIFLFCLLNYFNYSRKYILAIQSIPYSKIIELNNKDEFQSDLIRIANLIERQINGVEKFLDDFLNY